MTTENPPLGRSTNSTVSPLSRLADFSVFAMPRSISNGWPATRYSPVSHSIHTSVYRSVDHRGAASVCIVQGSTVTYHHDRDHLDDPRSVRQINCEKTSS